MKIRLEAAPLGKALALVASVVERRNTVPVLGCVRLKALNGSLSLAATNLDAAIAITLPAAIESEGMLCVDARALADAVRKLEKGAQVELAADADQLHLIAGRSRLKFASLPGDEFPAIVDQPLDDCAPWEAPADDASKHGLEGVDLSPAAAKALGKALKLASVETVTVRAMDGGEKSDSRLRVEAGNVVFVGTLSGPDPMLKYRTKRDRFSYGRDEGEAREAADYLRTLRRAHGLPAVPKGGEAPYYVEPIDETGELIVAEGRAIGLTMGAAWRDYAEARAMPHDWQPPAGTEIRGDDAISGAKICTVDGREYHRMGEHPWQYRHVPETPGALIYADGSYSLPMPAAQRRCVSRLTVDVDGERQPLKAADTGKLALSAEQVAALCGPVDPSTFVPMTAVAFHQGRVIATGDAAARFNVLQGEHFKRLRKIAKAPRTPERLAAYGAECDAFAPVVAALLANADVVEASIEAAGGMPAEPTPEAPAVHVPAVLEPTTDPFDGYSDASDFVDAPAEPEAPASIAAEPIEGPAIVDEPEAAPVQEPAPAAARVSDVEARLARLEAALNLTPAPKRSHAHAAAIRRAWAMRRQMREAAKLHALSLASGKAALVESRHHVARLNERVARAEGFAAERAELVAEIDRQRAAVLAENRNAVAVSHVMRRRFVQFSTCARAAMRLRSDLARTRAERDGLAVNLAAMASRVARDAATLERLQPTPDRPRIILSSRIDA